MSESFKTRIIKEATIYKGKRRELTEFEKKVNVAAAELCLSDISLLDRRGELLQKARKKAAENYVFKKGRSRSKAYGKPDSAPKRPKYDKEARDSRIKAIEEEVQDISRILKFKEKRLLQAEAAKNYRTCEQLTEEMMGLKSRKNELQVEKRLFDKKGKRAQRREAKRRQDSWSSDYAGSTPNSSRCETPVDGLLSPQGSFMSPPSVSGSIHSFSLSPPPNVGHFNRTQSQGPVRRTSSPIPSPNSCRSRSPLSPPLSTHPHSGSCDSSPTHSGTHSGSLPPTHNDTHDAMQTHIPDFAASSEKESHF